MYVTDIEITEISEDQSLTATCGSVVFTSYERQIQLLCNVGENEIKNPLKRRISLIRDGLRQLNRMPEFCAGRSEVTFGPGLIPEGAL